jgi:hypothetical protein
MRSFTISTAHPLLWRDKIYNNEMGGLCSTDVEESGVYRVLVEKPGGKRPNGRTRHRWEDSIKMELQGV